MTPRTPFPPPRPVTDPEMWKRLLNHLYINEEDELFRWATSVRAAVAGKGEGVPKPKRAA